MHKTFTFPYMGMSQISIVRWDPGEERTIEEEIRDPGWRIFVVDGLLWKNSVSCKLCISFAIIKTVTTPLSLKSSTTC